MSNVRFWKSFGRALAGALIFSFPLLMTMEMWWLGMYLESHRIVLFMLVLLPALVGLSRYSGFRRTSRWLEDGIDAVVAFVAGVLTSATFLALFGVIGPGMSMDEIIGKVTILSVPASMGAVIASKELGRSDENREERERTGYGGELFIMAAGALFLAFNVAPTEEMILIAYKMSHFHTIALVLISLLIMHLFVYSLEFKGQHEGPEGSTRLRLALHFTVAGYALSLFVSAYVLWTFGRLDGMALPEMITTVAVLGFPAALGAATARLVV